MKKNQSGNFHANVSFYKPIFGYINNGASLLNLGSGTQFNSKYSRDKCEDK